LKTHHEKDALCFTIEKFGSYLKDTVFSVSSQQSQTQPCSEALRTRRLRFLVGLEFAV
jgi:hypothetical protein